MKKHFPQYSRKLVPVARRLRRDSSDAEKKLWSRLRGSQLGYKFRRQVPYGKNVLDFYCHEVRLNIELDGSQHYTKAGKARDASRDLVLNKDGIDVVRFSNLDVLTNIDSVLNVIMERIETLAETKPTPS